MSYRRHDLSQKPFRITMILICLMIGISQYGYSETARPFNGPYEGETLNRVAFPIGGIGAGMVCMEGTGAISHVSLHGKLELNNEPLMFGAICVKKNKGNVARVLEGPVPTWKYYGNENAGKGCSGKSYGLPRFDNVEFSSRFPFGVVTLHDDKLPLAVEIRGWSPFIPGDADNSSLPVGALEYRFINTGDEPVDAVFSYHSQNFMYTGKGHWIAPIQNGFALCQGPRDHAMDEGAFAIYTDDDRTIVDHKWLFNRWSWDSLTVVWREVEQGGMISNPPRPSGGTGASLYVPFQLAPHGEKTIRVMFSWYVPVTDMQVWHEDKKEVMPLLDMSHETGSASGKADLLQKTYIPWYAGRFSDIQQVAQYWRDHYNDLHEKTQCFSDAFYSMTLPPEVIEAVAANLSILKSPTVLRQTDGRLWCWEGSCNQKGCCAGSCTHVWNYAQAFCHLFPDLERSLRHTEFSEMAYTDGSQAFRANLPICPGGASFKHPADGQLGGILKMYREWRILGDTEWLRYYWPRIRMSLDYIIGAMDPRRTGLIEEEHHNTYDINYFGPNGHCGSFYLAALSAAIQMGETLGDDVDVYRDLLAKGQKRLETELFNGEYFIQKIMKEGLDENFKPLPSGGDKDGYRDIIQTINEQGPVYQYGDGCLSDGVLGFWMAKMCGLRSDVADRAKIKSHLAAIYQYNMRHDLSEHANPQRPGYALGHEGGLLLCTWPHGGKLILPFVYSNEVWTGIEYQAAEHMMMEGMVDEGLDIVRTCRTRYDGRVRNPFDEYECGHWYGRALSSYGLIQALTGVRYDAVDKILYIDSKIGDNFTSFLSTASGFGNVGLKDSKPFVNMVQGRLEVDKVIVSGKAMSLEM